MSHSPVTKERRIDVKSLSGLLRRFSPLVCWKVGLYYGSMVYFEMGDKLEETMLDGSLNIIGSATLSLDGDNWCIHDHGVEIARSERISRDIAESDLANKFIGKALSKIKLDKNRTSVSVHFSDGMEIHICPDDKPISQMDEYDDIVTLILPNGEIAYFNPAKGLGIAAELDRIRHAYWINKPKSDTSDN